MTRNAATCTPRARTCDAAPALDAEAMRIAGHVRHLAAVVACMRAEGRALPGPTDSRTPDSPSVGAGHGSGAGVLPGGSVEACTLRPAADLTARAGSDLSPPR